ncbi:MAG: DUF2339 domain-containing protein [Calditrichaceae bacterium]|nr:DUF2339 domain-containing protein [Calditrichaceae bacterium]
MAENQDRINQLLVKLDSLLQRQSAFQNEIDLLKNEIESLKDRQAKSASGLATEEFLQTDVAEPIKKPEPVSESAISAPLVESQVSSTQRTKFKLPRFKTDLEKFIGENLINKIGIIIIIIAVIIGAKYAIDHQLISPLTRIILGYFVGLGFLGVAIRLKKNYENFSAVLLSGSMAIMYFITYAAYAFYKLFPQEVAFMVMVLFTVFTVIAAINYNKQVIAQIGLVGAYGVPFLLSEDTGRVGVLFTYMAIINAGILAISIKKYWKPLYYSSFALTWIIYSAWYVSDFTILKFFAFALSFAFIFFIIFHLTFLIYKIRGNEKFEKWDITLLLPNAFVFYAFGYTILSDHNVGVQLLGLYTIGNALIHFITGMIIYKREAVDKNLIYLVAGLALVFITIAIPVQLDGNWVTLLWAGEATLLFWIGRGKKAAIYEKISYPLIVLAFFSLIQDWATVYNTYIVENPDTWITPIFNINFLTSFLCIAAFGLINFLQFRKKFPSAIETGYAISTIMKFVIPIILLIVLYYSFRLEIETYCDQLYQNSRVELQADSQYTYPQFDYDLKKYKTIWVINYSLFFMIALSLINIKKLKNNLLALYNLGLNAFTIFVFLVMGLLVLSELRDSYLTQYLAEYYNQGVFNIYIRYIALLLTAVLLYTSYCYIHQDFIKKDFSTAFDFVLHGSSLWIVSSELIHWMDIFDSAQSYKLGLSILWGSYALFLIILGIWKKKRYLRISAIVLFGVTLLKLFFYDAAHLGTIAKTILFLILGILLLVISFLYNKYKNLIFDEDTN